MSGNGGIAVAEIMEYEKVVEILELYTQIDKDIRFLRKFIKDMNDEYYTPSTSTNYDGLPKGNNTSNITEDLAMNVPKGVSAELKESERRIAEYQQLKTEILKEISRLKYKQKTIIFDKYINGLKWEQVAVRNHYTSRQCKNIRREAVNCLAVMFAQNEIISKFKIAA